MRSVCEAYSKGKSQPYRAELSDAARTSLVAAKPLWDEILAMTEGQTMRGFPNRHADEIEYVPLDTPTILQDLDTPDDYLKYKPPL